MGINYPIQNGLSILYIENSTIMVPQSSPQVLCHEEAPHQLGALQVQEAADQSSLVTLFLLHESESATPLVHPFTTLGPPQPLYGPIFPDVHPATPN